MNDNYLLQLPWPEKLLNIASWHILEDVLGPGRRLCLWTQGCPRNCPGCIAPDWGVIRANILNDPTAFADHCLQESFSGVTISGGEPFLQTWALRVFLERILLQRSVNIICFSGFNYEALPAYSRHSSSLLGLIDVLIDGPYQQDLNDGIGLRGSSNQRIHYLTDKLKGADLEFYNRRVVIVKDLYSGSLIAGIPSLTMDATLKIILSSIGNS
jgi:anaerobic ribonucleoside-triphosphate reductase activating protein